MSREELNKIVKNLALITQLGLSFIMPTLLCVWLSWYLNMKKGVGLWIYIPGFILGLGSSFMTAYKFYLSVISKEKKEDKDKKVSFNEHL